MRTWAACHHWSEAAIGDVWSDCSRRIPDVERCTLKPPSSPSIASKDGERRPSTRAVRAVIRVDDDFEDEYPGASALATECYANTIRTGQLLLELHNRQTVEEYQLSASARDLLFVVDGAGQPLEPSVIAERLLVTTGSMTSLLDNLEKRGLIRRQPHPDDRRKLLIDITPAARPIVEDLLPSLHARERDVIAAALSPNEQRTLLRSLAKLQQAARAAQSAPPSHDATRRRPHRLRD